MFGAISLRSISPHPALRATFPRKGGRGFPALLRRSPRARPQHVERLPQILDQVFDVLEPDRKPEQAWPDSERRALVGLETLMRRRLGVGDQALRVAQIVRNAYDRERVGRRKRGCLVAVD